MGKKLTDDRHAARLSSESNVNLRNVQVFSHCSIKKAGLRLTSLTHTDHRAVHENATISSSNPWANDWLNPPPCSDLTRNSAQASYISASSHECINMWFSPRGAVPIFHQLYLTLRLLWHCRLPSNSNSARKSAYLRELECSFWNVAWRISQEM